jgi:aryl-alcohol dehydrogenase-like predicted oxidoreductase
MEKAPFGSLGWKASRLGLGTMPLAIQGRPPEGDAVRLIHRALDAGINWLDTANTYCLDDAETGYGERLVGRALREWTGGDRDAIVVITKGGWRRPNAGWVIDGDPASLKSACEASLTALGVSAITLYLLHAPDPKVPFADSVGALLDLQRAGKIQHIGLSNVDAGHIREAQKTAVIRSVQNRFNIFDQFPLTAGVVDHCARHDIALVAHSVVGGHTGNVRAGENDALKAVALRRGLTPHQVALLWLLAKVPGIFAIPGARRFESLDANVAVAGQSLPPEEMTALSGAFPPATSARRAFVRARNELRRFGREAKHRFARA